MTVEVRLYATLRRHSPPGSGGVITVDAEENVTVEEILRQLNVDIEEVKLIMINGLNTQLTQTLTDGDRLGVFPPVGGG